ncbi:MAG: family 10 glycosylhydrolase [Chloroflexi bacterium]|nr:family 10 glycosylhydrolase [Chloroflexota bacterium]
MRSRIIPLLTALAVILAACLPAQPSPTPTAAPRQPDAARQSQATPAPPPSTPAPEPTVPAPTATAKPTPVPRQAVAAGEYRAFWVDAFHEGFKTPEQVDRLLASVRLANANTVVVQVRRRGDAYFAKRIEPRTEDAELASGFDALQYLIEKAHGEKPRIEVHAWLATLPIWKGSFVDPSDPSFDPRPRYADPRDPRHPFNTHGPKVEGQANWIAKNHRGEQFDGNNFSLDPGHPDALDYTVDVYLDVLRKYDVDGIHLDYVRYAEKLWGYNDTSVERFKQRYGRTAKPAIEDPLWTQWRRDQITALLRKLYLNAIAVKPGVKVSAATIAWVNGPVREEDWSRSSPYARTFQDWRAWLEEGIVDIAMPMAYFRESDPVHRDWYDQWIEWSKNHRYSRHVSIGLGIWQNSPAETFDQISRALAPSKTGQRADGVSLYSWAITGAAVPDSSELALRGVRLTTGQWQQLRDDNAAFYRGLSTEGPGSTSPVFPKWVPTPEMPWKSRPTTGHLMGTVTGADGRPLDGALVTIAGPASRKLETDGTGFYGFVDLPPGRYTIAVNLNGKDVTTGKGEIEIGKVARVDLG